MTQNLTNFDAALKEYYTSEEIFNLVYKNNPAFALFKKNADFYGDSKPIVVIHGNPQGRSASFSQAQSQAANEYTRVKRFLLTRVQDYGVVHIDRETMLATGSDKGAFLDARITEINAMLSELGNTIETDLFRAGWGDRGVIGSISTVTITLATIEDIVNFEVGQVLQLSSSQNAAVLRDSGDSVTITAVDRTLGKITCSADVATQITGATAGDYIFIKGDRENSATPTREKIAGMDAWLPSTAPSGGDSFFGLDRSVDTTRLAGVRYDASSQPIEEGIIDAARLLGREGGSPDHLFVSFDKFADLEKSLGSKVNYVDLKVGDIGFRAMRIIGPTGDIKVLPARCCPSSAGYLLEKDTWAIESLKEMPHVFNDDGLQMLRQASSDGYEVRFGYYGNLACRAPGRNCRITF